MGLPNPQYDVDLIDHDGRSVEAGEQGQIVEKEPCKCIKFATTTSPLPFNLWIQIVPVTETECKMTVSYTHLDVYKRQDMHCLGAGLVSIAALLSAQLCPTSVAVHDNCHVLWNPA